MGTCGGQVLEEVWCSYEMLAMCLGDGIFERGRCGFKTGTSCLTLQFLEIPFCNTSAKDLPSHMLACALALEAQAVQIDFGTLYSEFCLQFFACTHLVGWMYFRDEGTSILIRFFNFCFCFDNPIRCGQNFFPECQNNMNIHVYRKHLWFHVFCRKNMSFD